ncbi:hypothetical protein NX722_11725 [Endozoicomonas gorgoniicola]|uniref:Uncharacterized protein n=1 Tax=Endozoicomonas gorgoniicola TaxID=1234144 RepID=A0ABT3MVB1_9GAMM|nr:hypothetical protein [Endozoicomonas gorgoniicola]MCW7553294.1 hypothetical protein [Endozoicomonas gorgoniicola]
MLTPEEIDYLVGYLTALGGRSQLLLQTLLIMIYNDSNFGKWLYDIYSHCELDLATDLVVSAIEMYLQEHGFCCYQEILTEHALPLNP